MTEPTKEQREEFWSATLDRFVEVIMGKTQHLSPHGQPDAANGHSTEESTRRSK